MIKTINTIQFISWFGDWKNKKNCSKVVDENGFPLIVYHGSPNDFQEFKSEFMGTTGTALGQGFYFTSNEDDAKYFGENVKKFFLNIRKPLHSNKLTMNKNDIFKLLDNIDKCQIKNDPDFGYGILSDFGDVDYEGRRNVLVNAVNMLLEEPNDVELVGGLINATNDYNLVVNVLRDTLGYDGIINYDRGIYVVHHPNQIKQINNVNFNSDSNNFTESIKKIKITESQFEMLKNIL